MMDNLNKLFKELVELFIFQDYRIEELERAFNESNIEVDENELKKIISYTEAQDGSGKIEYTDFIVASLDQKEFIDKERLITAFKYFDVDSSGFIDSSDVKKALLRFGKNIMNEKDVDKMIDEVTTEDSKFKVSLDDFLKMFFVNFWSADINVFFAYKKMSMDSI